MSTNVPITVAHGDGIGPEIIEASLHIIQEAGARIHREGIEIGQNSSGIEPSSCESLRRTKVFYKAPITTPQGGGFKSLGETTSKKTVALLGRVLDQDLEIVKTETLRTYDGAIGYTLALGQ